MKWLNAIKALFSSVEKSAEGVKLWPMHGTSALFSKRSTDGTKLMEQAMGWVYACISRIGDDIGSARLRLYKKTGQGPEDWEELTNHPMLDLLDRPNAMQPRFELFELWSMHEDLAGNAYWLLDGVKSDRDVPTAIYPLNPSTVKPLIGSIPGSPDMIVGYELNVDGKRRLLKAHEVLHFRKPNPANGFVGLGPTEAAVETIDSENWMREWNRRFFQNAAIPSAILETNDTSPVTIQQLRESFEDRHAGIERSHKVVVLPAGVKYADKGFGQKDMDFSELRRLTRDEILAFYGVPGVVLGLGLGETINRASAETLEYVYMKHTVAPKLRRFVTFLNEFFVTRFGDDLVLEFDDPVPENVEMTIKLDQAALGNEAFMTPNEVRAKNGLPPVDGGDVLMSSSMLVPIGKPQKAARAVKKSVMRSLPHKAKKRAHIEEKKEAMAKDIAHAIANIVSETKKKALEDLKAEDWAPRWKAFIERVTPEETKMRDVMAEYAHGMAERAKDELRRKIGKARKSKIPQLLDKADEVQAIIEAMSPVYLEILKKEGVAAADMVGAAFDETEKRMRSALDKAINLMARSYTDETLAKLKDRIGQGLDEGLGLDDLTEYVSDVEAWSATSRAETVARTEAFRTANFATKEAWKQSGVVSSIRWYTAEDERVCPYCGDFDGKIVGIDENFADKGDTVSGTDADGNEVTMSVDYADVEAGSLHPNCRCYVRPEVIGS